ncbi:hypothetical protein L1987_17933 [Smallanthus sonchifolius]|uniref:Uncharacterized protein n=1 Tax=Smallanthus sonchifolius TaxID=185202 RepID=A0ACB9J0V4_9ASTR|nr:hypothetical protein L1987_17933 [Smallanthus sonchifolius]
MMDLASNDGDGGGSRGFRQSFTQFLTYQLKSGKGVASGDSGKGKYERPMLVASDLSRSGKSKRFSATPVSLAGLRRARRADLAFCCSHVPIYKV